MATTAKKAAAKPAAKTPTSTAVAVKKSSSGALVSIKEQLAAQVAANQGRVAPESGITIRVGQDKTFSMPDGTKSRGPLQLVVLDFAYYNAFYEGTYDPKNISPPACFALSPLPKDMVPSASSPARQSDDCSSCPMNVFGSAGDGKACKNQVKLAVLPPDADEDTPIWLLNVSPTALKGFNGFVGSVARTFNVPPIGVVVEIGFDDTVTYARLAFSDPAPNENVGVHFARQAEAQKLLGVEPDVSSYGQAKPARAPARAPARKAVAGARR